MSTFLFYSGPNINSVEPRLKLASRILGEVVPLYRHGTNAELVVRRDQNFACCILRTNGNGGFISFREDKEWSILVYGTDSRNPEQELGDVISSAWAAGGARAVRLLDCSFSAVIVEHRSGAVHIVSDQTGLRTLQFVQSSAAIWISPHNIALVAGGATDSQVNQLAVYSLLRMRVALGDMSLLAGAQYFNPQYYHTWEHSKLNKTRSTFLDTVDRVQPGDDSSIKDLSNKQVGYLDGYFKQLSLAGHSVGFDITAGMDTRVVMTLLLRHFGAEILHGYNTVTTSDRDARIASVLARHYKFQLNLKSPEGLAEDVAKQRYLANAFYTSGHGSAEYDLTDIDDYRRSFDQFYTGHSAIANGYYYPVKTSMSYSHVKTLDLGTYLCNKTFKLQPVSSRPDLEEKLQHEIHNRLSEFSLISANKYDILDLFKTYTRIGRFGSLFPRREDFAHRISVFEQPEMIRLFFSMPAPISQRFRIYRNILNRDAQRSGLLLVNGKYFVPALSSESTAWFADKAIRGYNKISRAVRRPPKQDAGPGPHTARLVNKAMELSSDVHGIIAQCFTDVEVDTMFSPYLSNARQLKVIAGHILRMEAWYSMVREVEQRVRSESR